MKQADHEKRLAAEAAVAYVEPNTIIGVGTGTTANYFIEALSNANLITQAVASSQASADLLQRRGIEVISLNEVSELPLYVDGADQINSILQLIKGGGGALTREKIVAAAAKTFVCIADSSKIQGIFGHFPLPVEIIPMARSYVARQLVQLGGNPVYREGFMTDNGNMILDVYNLTITTPIELEESINNIAGVVCNGLFAARSADTVLLGDGDQVKTLNI